MIRIFAIILMLTSCAHQSPELPDIPELKRTIEILKKAGDIGKLPHFIYAPLKKDSAGYYNRIEDTIHINSRIWPLLTIRQQRMVLIHEIGHGALKRPHLNTIKFEDGCPESIMLYNIAAKCYTDHKEYYLNELFEDKGRIYE